MHPPHVDDALRRPRGVRSIGPTRIASGSRIHQSRLESTHRTREPVVRVTQGWFFFRARSRYRGGGDDDDVHTATRDDADADADADADFAR